MTETNGKTEGVWVRFCPEHQWLSPVFRTYADVLQSHATDGHNKSTGCVGRTVGRLPADASAATLAARLPDWAQEIYWGRKGAEYFASQVVSS